MRHVICGAVFAAVVGVAGAQARAQASDAAQARSLYQQGVQLSAQGHDEESIDVFRRAWELGHQPLALAHLGLAEQATGRWVAAEAHLREALEQHADDPGIRRQRAPLETSYAVAQQHVAQLELRCNVDGAHLTVDGAEVGTTPLAAPINVQTGGVAVAVTADGYETVRRDVLAIGGHLNRELVELQHLPSAAPTAAPSAPPVAQPPDWTLRTVGIVGLVTGGVLVGGGLAFNIWREVAAADFNATCPQRGFSGGGPNCGSDLTAGDVGTPLAVVGYVAGGTILAASALILVVFGQRQPAHDHAFRCSPTSTGGMCSVSF